LQKQELFNFGAAMTWADITSRFEQLMTFQINFGDIHISVVKLVLVLLIFIAAIIIAKLVTKFIVTRLLSRLPLSDNLKLRSKWIIQILLFLTLLLSGLLLMGFDLTLVNSIYATLNTPIKIGQSIEISINDLFVFVILLTLSVYLSKFLSNLLMTKGLSRTQIDTGTKYVLKRVTEYALITIGGIIAFQTVGINLSGLAVIFGLLSVGIGFGLQNIASNFISGIILLFERPIQVGDRITVGDTDGDVEEINIRATTIRSLDNISIIVPNTEFVEGRVTNWSHGDLKVRMTVDVGVSYNSDLQTVLTALREVADESSLVLKDPKPEVLLMEFGDSSWNMQLRVWIADPKEYYRILSSINCDIVFKFRERQIEIPFPQRDLHLRSAVPISQKN
jgi:small-conductance mechanosensitive channel